MFSRASKETSTQNKSSTVKAGTQRQQSANGLRDQQQEQPKDQHESVKKSTQSSNISKPPQSKPNIAKSQQSHEKNKAQTEFYMGLIKDRQSINNTEGSNSAISNSKPSSQKIISSSIKKKDISQQLDYANDDQDEQSFDQSGRAQEFADEQKQIKKKQADSQKTKQNLASKGELEQLKDELNQLNRSNYEQNIKLKEEKMEQKRLKAKISQLESEKNNLVQQIKEKDQIIQQGLQKMKSQFTEKRNFLIQSQMIKQRRYIQHLTKLTKSNKTISAELEYQLDYLKDLIEKVSNDCKQQSISQQNEQKLDMAKQTIINLRKKLEDLKNQTAFNFSSNLLKEFDVNSDKDISKQTFLIQLEQSANKLFNSSLNMVNSYEHKNKEMAQVTMDIKEFVEGCLRYGMDIQMGENEYEVIKSNEEIRNDVLRSVREKIGGFEQPMIDNILFNGQLFEFLHKIQLDRNQLIHKYKNTSAVETYVNSLITNEQNKKILKQIGVLHRVKECIGMDLNLLNKMNNIIRTLFFQSQISLQYLNEFVVQQLQTLNQIISECIFKPFTDMYEIYQKYHKQEKNNNYPIHLAQIFNMNCEQMKVNIESIINLQHQEVFQTNRSMNLPLITQIQKVYQELYGKLEQ
ncbi:hypothetical protein ABPG74_018472 [Tetrahymena malaccensis]